MNRDDFRDEIGLYIKDKYVEFLKYQDVVNDIFDVFCNLSEKYNIKYYMAFGSLIGAIRDGGNIPWDYDMDLWVPISQRDKLIDCLEKNLGQEYYYVYKNNVKNYPTDCLRICKKGFPFTVIHLDVFFLIGCPSQDNEKKHFLEQLDIYHSKRMLKYGYQWFPNSKQRNNVEKIQNVYLNVRRRLISANQLERNENQIYFRYPLETSEFCCTVGDSRYKKIYRTEWFADGITANFCSKIVNVPTQYETILKTIYGDYTKYLPVESRFEEFYKSMSYVKQRCENDPCNVMLKSILFNGVKGGI